LYDSREIVAITQDGKVIAQARRAQVLAAGDRMMNIRVPDLRYIEYVLNVSFFSNPDTWLHHHMDPTIVGNVVGMTIYQIQAGTTLTVEVIAIGPP
jgi:hypothetical protein